MVSHAMSNIANMPVWARCNVLRASSGVADVVRPQPPRAKPDMTRGASRWGGRPASSGKSRVLHRFVCGQALVFNCNWAEVAGRDVTDGVAGFLERGCSAANTSEAVELTCNNRFRMAQRRTYEGFTQEEEGEWDGDYDFVQLADPQFGMLHFDKSWKEEEAMLRLAVQHVNRLKPRFLLISGDLSNAFPSGPEAAPEAARRQIASFKEVMQDLDSEIPIVMQPGNHDIGQAPLPADVQAYTGHFGDDYFSFWVGGVFYLNINSQYYMDAAHTQELRQDQDRWIASELARTKAHHIVILSHVPPFVGHEEEPQGWATWEPEPRKRILAAAEAAQAKIWFSGHLHGNATTHTRHGMEIVVTSSCASTINWIQDAPRVATAERPDFKAAVGAPPVIADPHHSGLRIVRVRKRGFQHRWLALADVPESLEDVFGDEIDEIDRNRDPSSISGLSE